MVKTVAIIQARMSSSRLPGKVLLALSGKPMLQWVLERVGMAKSVDLVGVATSTDPSDDPLADFCCRMGYPCVRGSMHDVLDRYFRAAWQFMAGTVVRVTADCPLIDPALIDLTIAEFNSRGVDFAANRLPPPWGRTYPIGLDTEVCSFAALERAWVEAKLPFEREHVMPYLYNEPGRFKTFLLNHEVDYGALRWTVDTPEDLELLRAIFSHFADKPAFTWLDVLEYYQRNPQLAKINAHVQHKTVSDVDERREK
jgi:spore coat polysaccharide biosynthesis protein SpsF